LRLSTVAVGGRRAWSWRIRPPGCSFAYPLHRLPRYLGNPLKVAVAVQHGHLVPFRYSGYDQLGPADVVLFLFGKLTVHLDGPKKVSVVSGEPAERCGPYGLDVGQVAMAADKRVQLEVYHPAGRQLTRDEQRPQDGDNLLAYQL